MTRRLVVLGLSGLVGALPAFAQNGPESPRLRRELRAMEALLDQTVEQVSRPNAGFVLAGAPSSRGYLLPGQGVVFVLPPRRLPTPPMVLAQNHRGLVMIQRARGSDLRKVEAQVAEFQRQAQQQWYDLERSFFEVQSRLLRAAGETQAPAWNAATATSPLSPTSLPASAAETPLIPAPPRAPVTTAELPSPPEAPMEPAPPAPPAFPEAPTAAPSQPPAPPWTFWIDEMAEDPEPRSADRVVADTRNALIQVLETYGHLLASVPPDETVSVVVDFVAGAPFLDENARPARSLSLRVRKRDLDERGAGRLSSEDLRHRLQTAEY